MSPIRRKGRFVLRDVDKRKTFFRNNFAGVRKKTAVNMIVIKCRFLSKKSGTLAKKHNSVSH